MISLHDLRPGPATKASGTKRWPQGVECECRRHPRPSHLRRWARPPGQGHRALSLLAPPLHSCHSCSTHSAEKQALGQQLWPCSALLPVSRSHRLPAPLTASPWATAQQAPCSTNRTPGVPTTGSTVPTASAQQQALWKPGPDPGCRAFSVSDHVCQGAQGRGASLLSRSRPADTPGRLLCARLPVEQGHTEAGSAATSHHPHGPSGHLVGPASHPEARIVLGAVHALVAEPDGTCLGPSSRGRSVGLAPPLPVLRPPSAPPGSQGADSHPIRLSLPGPAGSLPRRVHWPRQAPGLRVGEDAAGVHPAAPQRGRLALASQVRSQGKSLGELRPGGQRLRPLAEH